MDPSKLAEEGLGSLGQSTDADTNDLLNDTLSVNTLQKEQDSQDKEIIDPDKRKTLELPVDLLIDPELKAVADAKRRKMKKKSFESEEDKKNRERLKVLMQDE